MTNSIIPEGYNYVEESFNHTLLHELGHSIFSYILSIDIYDIKIGKSITESEFAGVSYTAVDSNVNKNIIFLLAGTFNTLLDIKLAPNKDWNVESWIEDNFPPYVFKNDGTDFSKLIEIIIENTEYDEDDFYDKSDEYICFDEYKQDLINILVNYINAILEIMQDKSYISLMNRISKLFFNKYEISGEELKFEFRNLSVDIFTNSLDILKKYKIWHLENKPNFMHKSNDISTYLETLDKIKKAAFNIHTQDR